MAQNNPSGEGRALSAALSAPTPFISRASSMALHAADRHVERWAPERDATARSRSLGTLSFVDRLIGPWMASAQPTLSRSTGRTSASPERPVSWIFPRPWYQDELDWMAASREAQSQGMFTTRGTYAAPSTAAQAPLVASVRSAGQTVVVMADDLPRVTRDVEGESPVGGAEQAAAAAAAPAIDPWTRASMATMLEYVAPSMSAPASRAQSRSAMSAAPTVAAAPVGFGAALGTTALPAVAPSPMQRALRAWSPNVSFAATQAAEVMAATVAIADRAGLTVAERSPVLGGLSYVAPAELAAVSTSAHGPQVPDATAVATRVSVPVPATPALAMAPETAIQIARTVAQLAAVQAASRTTTTEAARDAIAIAAPIPTASPVPAPIEAAAPSTPVSYAPMVTPSVTAPAVETAYRAEQQRVIDAIATAPRAAAPSASAPTAAPAPTPAGIGQASQPGTIADLVQLAAASPMASQALRTVELLARSMLSGATAPASGPRVAMPAGLGGTLIGLEAAAATQHPMVSAVGGDEAAEPGALPASGRLTHFVPSFAGQPIESAGIEEHAVAPRRFAPIWTAPTSVTPTVSAIAAERPAAMAHLAWSDRWLARFAGASPASLAALDIASDRVSTAPRALAASAPEVVFVLPPLLGRDTFAAPSAAPPVATPRPVVATVPGAPPVTEIPALPPIGAAPRIDDDEATPDEVFAAIARAARPSRPRPPATVASAPTAPAPASSPVEPSLTAVAPEGMLPRMTLADQVARSAPMAPVAGLHAELASSPMAAALASILPMPAAPVFDPRALFGGGVTAAYVGGALSRSLFVPPSVALGVSAEGWRTSPMTFLARAQELSNIAAASPIATPSTDAPLGIAARAPSATFVSPEPGVPRAEVGEPFAAQADAPVASAPTAAPAFEPSWSVHSPLLAPIEMAAGDPVNAAAILGVPVEMVAPALGRSRPAPRADVLASAELSQVAPEVSRAAAAAPAMESLAPFAPVARGATFEHPLHDVGAPAWSPRPGMTGEMAHGFAVTHERVVADLAFDFVPAELVLAAQVYGLGPIEAAQASRLAVAGPAGVSAMASSLDLIFLQQLHRMSTPGAAPSPWTIGPQTSQAPVVARPVPTPAMPVVEPAVEPAEATVAPTATVTPTAAAPTPAAGAPALTAWPVTTGFAPPVSFGAAHGVDRRLPRGVFLWPTGAVAALDMRAQLPTGAGATTIAALELLAAGAVADMATLVAPWSPAADHAAADAAMPDAPASSFARPALPSTMVAAQAQAAQSRDEALARAAGAQEAVEPGVDEIAEAVAIPAPQRARFESIYLALASSPAGASLSPSVRAARALAIATSQDSTTPAAERARAAWSVIPMIYSGDRTLVAPSHDAGASGSFEPRIAGASEMPDAPAMPMSAGWTGAGTRPSAMPVVAPEAPALSSRIASAGEALGAYVQPSAPEVRGASSQAAQVSGPVDRSSPASFVHEVLRSGRSFSKMGGGEAEIPACFEQAARHMLASRGLGENISIAELTLIASAPSHQVAASTRGESPAPSMAAAPPGQAGAEQGEKPDIDKIAADVYGEVMKMVEIAKERNGDPYL